MRMQLKYRIFAAFLLPLFIVAGSGWTVFVHHCIHCQDQVVTFLQEDNSSCCERPHHHDNNGKDVSSHQTVETGACCSHSALEYKIKSDFDKDSDFRLVLSFITLAEFYPTFKQIRLNKRLFDLSFYYPPPNWQVIGAVSSSMRL